MIALLSFVAYLGLPPLVHGQDYNFTTKWGSLGNGDGQFYNPAGVAVDNNGNVYVVDSSNQRIQKFDSNGQLLKWSTQGGEFSSPYGIASDSNGNIFVTDQRNNNVQVFNNTGGFLGKFPRHALAVQQGDITKYIVKNGFFNQPMGIAINREHHLVYVVDTGNNRIQKFNGGGYFLATWGEFGRGEGEFNNPTGIAVDSENYVYVTDTGNKRVEKFDGNGNLVKAWSVGGYHGTGLDNPGPIAVDYSGDIYVGDLSGGKIQKFDQEGNLLTEWGSLGESDGQFRGIGGIAVDQSGNVYASDTSNNRIQKFGSPIHYMPDLQLVTNIVDQRLDSLLLGPTGKMILIPSSVHGAIVTSGKDAADFGLATRIGAQPSIPPGHSAKVVAITIQSKAQQSAQNFWFQLGYQDSKSEFIARQNLMVTLQKNGLPGDSITTRLPEPFFVPSDQLSSGGTNLFVRMASDGHYIPVEVSLSLILDP